MTRQELLSELNSHDWYHMYSDDHNVWQRGSIDAMRLKNLMKDLNCPFEFWDIHKAIRGLIVEKLEEVEPGKFRNKNWHSATASQSRSDLITQELADKILKWFANTNESRGKLIIHELLQNGFRIKIDLPNKTISEEYNRLEYLEELAGTVSEQTMYCRSNENQNTYITLNWDKDPDSLITDWGKSLANIAQRF